MQETDAQEAREQVDESLLAISASEVDIKYKVLEEPNLTARHLFSRGMKTRRSIHVHAVKNVSFDVRIGEALGIVGSNGSGKSTLLRAIAGLQSLSHGSILVRGEVGLLGVGAALKPSLSGYRNVILGGLALGMSYDEIDSKMSEVIEFSGLGDAMGRPLNTYSSGMRSRLAFTVATLRVPDILLIDEALAVGDKEFRERSLARLNEIRSEAGTIVMVSHNLNEIRQTCQRAIWLDQGDLVSSGTCEDVLTAYEQSN